MDSGRRPESLRSSKTAASMKGTMSSWEVTSQWSKGVKGFRELQLTSVTGSVPILGNTYSRACMACSSLVMRSLTVSHFKFGKPGTQLSCTLVWSSRQYNVKAMFSSCFENIVISSNVRGFLATIFDEDDADGGFRGDVEKNSSSPIVNSA